MPKIAIRQRFNGGPKEGRCASCSIEHGCVYVLIPSSTGETSWTVRLIDGNWDCGCPAFCVGNPLNIPCKHIDMASLILIRGFAEYALYSRVGIPPDLVSDLLNAGIRESRCNEWPVLNVESILDEMSGELSLSMTT